MYLWLSYYSCLCSWSPAVQQELPGPEKTENENEDAKKRHFNVVFIGHVGKLIFFTIFVWRHWTVSVDMWRLEITFLCKFHAFWTHTIKLCIILFWGICKNTYVFKLIFNNAFEVATEVATQLNYSWFSGYWRCKRDWKWGGTIFLKIISATWVFLKKALLFL